MSAPTKIRPAKKSAAKKTTQNRTGTSARVRANSDARDAVLRAAEQAREDGRRASLQAEHAQGPRIATIDDVRELAADLPEKFLHCRDYGHQWKMADTDSQGRGRQKIYTRTMFCPSCKFNKFQTFDYIGTMVEEKLDYPEGYLMKGKGRITRDTKGIIRVASMDRYIEKKASR